MHFSLPVSERNVIRVAEENESEESANELPVPAEGSTSAGESQHSWMEETYEEMKRLAASFMAKETPTISLTPTVLVHEVYMRMANQGGARFVSRGHFLAVAATMMRRILVDHARAKARTKRGGDHVRVQFDESMALSTSRNADVLALEDALMELAELDDRQAKIVEMRFFGGMTVPEVAEVLQLSTRTIENEWKLSRAWLRRRLETSQAD